MKFKDIKEYLIVAPLIVLALFLTMSAASIEHDERDTLEARLIDIEYTVSVMYNEALGMKSQIANLQVRLSELHLQIDQKVSREELMLSIEKAVEEYEVINGD